jgi:hypothetical protein
VRWDRCQPCARAYLENATVSCGVRIQIARTLHPPPDMARRRWGRAAVDSALVFHDGMAGDSGKPVGEDDRISTRLKTRLRF